jgi:acetyl-CoA carboxylase, biotin carboxylase subunit
MPPAAASVAFLAGAPAAAPTPAARGCFLATSPLSRARTVAANVVGRAARAPVLCAVSAEAVAKTGSTAPTEVRPIRKVLVANRGEIAIRVIRSCQEMGIASVAVYSTADAEALHVTFADEAVCIGDAPSVNSYLSVPNLLAACAITKADAIHPGYGFLSENAEFADICNSMGITFIGPRSESIVQMGDKATAKETMIAAGVPCVPGSRGLVPSPEEARKQAGEIGYPVMLKATAGGGGRGIKIVWEEGEVEMAFKTCSSEAQAAFSNGGLYMEKYVQAPRHVEIQLMADQYNNAVHLFERDCSVQRRNQKLIEEAPSPALSPDLRNKMGAAAVNAAKAIGYRGAGTVEFLLDATGDFYFMEMNTRIQVEHPVTEAITGIDLIREQIRVAEGHPLGFTQGDLKINGHAIEARINAEDPMHNFRPMPGLVTGFLPPGGNGVRWDGQVFTGWRIPQHYDSLLGKLIVWAPTRAQAIQKLRRALGETAVEGVPTTIPFHEVVLDNPTFQRGEYATDFIEKEGILDTLRDRGVN